ncbi:MAG: hypothetical protein P8Y94_10935 [Acidobacteriota bacterium]
MAQTVEKKVNNTVQTGGPDTTKPVIEEEPGVDFGAILDAYDKSRIGWIGRSLA